ncbi:type I methionyl aminopeptidase [Candidatus Shapirobacteria bacterium CG09_land_8_20_14_0_10_49_15]|uniref:Methionine aminopeptidase n=2 Tax=Candidatus Shapironibacteriota TaxID=1752721 RepID=A0A2M8L6S2_9BACT|nr:MAG: type I methionyl aminopeptidase [Candidatus Shapirobacteria bacterium CG09_land_8_20_14_0_10_49_15]PJE69944.1 MAG: type I methionyl aminopeptidase [Candidatus Shapirobacteria bacterium CG10_big_fil_rev_8_21_14_0_10_48_15]
MIAIRTDQQAALLQASGSRLARVFAAVLLAVRPGVALQELDQLADELIQKQGGQASFKTVKNYYWATCLNVNEGVVHGIPDGYRLKKGDLLSIDMGMLYQGWHTDMARSLIVGGGDSKFLQAGRLALAAATRLAVPGNRVGHLSQVIERVISQAGFRPVRQLTGHGVGRRLHEEPQIPCFLDHPLTETPLLEAGMSLAVEVIYTQGQPELVLADNGWTLESADGLPAALFEDSLIVSVPRSLVLTRLSSDSLVK